MRLAERINNEVLSNADSRGIRRGAYVSWTVRFGPNATGTRFGCVMRVGPDAVADVQASNGKLRIPVVLLTHEPDCKDAIEADQKAIYGR